MPACSAVTSASPRSGLPPNMPARVCVHWIGSPRTSSRSWRRSLRRTLVETTRVTGIYVLRSGRRLVSFSSNDYLNLTQHPKVKEAAIEAMRSYGAGAGASRLVTGNHPLFAELEGRLARLKGPRLLACSAPAISPIPASFLRWSARTISYWWTSWRMPASGPARGWRVPTCLPSATKMSRHVEKCWRCAPAASARADRHRRRVLDGRRSGAAAGLAALAERTMPGCWRTTRTASAWSARAGGGLRRRRGGRCASADGHIVQGHRRIWRISLRLRHRQFHPGASLGQARPRRWRGDGFPATGKPSSTPPQILAEFGIAHEARVVSAHRMPDEMFAYAEAAAGRGLQAIIAGAGGAAHLPGMLAAKTTVPVLGVPVASRHLHGVDSLHSIVQMPKGIPVATFAIGRPARRTPRCSRWRCSPRRRALRDAARGFRAATDRGGARDDAGAAGLPTESSVRRARTLGVLGGGQLGRMFVHAAQRWATARRCSIRTPASPAGLVAHHHVRAEYLDEQGLAADGAAMRGRHDRIRERAGRCADAARRARGRWRPAPMRWRSARTAPPRRRSSRAAACRARRTR